MILKYLIPYNVRLWWALRQMPTCTCEIPGRAPPFHEEGCPVKEKWADG